MAASGDGLEKLTIEIEADATGASRKLDTLIKKLGQLQLATNGLSSSASGIDSLARSISNLSMAINGMDDTKLKNITRSLSNLGNAAKNISSLGQKLVVLRQSAEGVNDAANGVKTDRSLDEIEREISKFQQLKDVAENTKSALRDSLRGAKVNIPEDFWGNNSGIDAKRLRGFIGIRNTNNRGFSGDDQIREAIMNSGADNYDGRGSVADITNSSDLFTRLGQILQTLNSEIDENNRKIHNLEAEYERLGSEFMPMDDIDLDGDEIDFFTHLTDNASEAVSNLRTNLESVEAQNPFSAMVDGLKELEGLNFNADGLNGLSKLMNTISRMASNGDTVGQYLQALASGLKSLSENSGSIPNLEGMADFVKQIGKLNGKKIQGAVSSFPSLVRGLQQISQIGSIQFPNMDGIAEFAKGISLLGRVKVGEAINNIPRLTTAIKDMMQVLSNAPAVSDNVIRMTNALSNLSQQGARVGSAGNSLTRAFQNTGTQSGRTTSLLGGLKSGLSKLVGHFKHTQKASAGLASSIGMLYAKFFMLFRLMGLLKQAMDLSSDVTEVQNVVDTTFGQYAKAVDEMAKTSIEQYGMSELTVKQTASRFQAMGNAMGISSAQVQKATDFLAKNNSVYDVTGNKMADMSIELTKLTADMASFYNMEQDVVGEKLAAIFTGQTRPLRDFGLDLTQATLESWAMANGIDADIRSMSQAEKTMLRYQYVMAQTSSVMGDFARTSDTWANQTRMLRQNFEQLGIVIGQGLINMLKPAVKAMNSFLQKVTKFASNVVNALGKIFGWKVEISTAGITDDLQAADASIGDLSDGAGDAGKNLGGAADKAKELKEQLMGFDKLNVITTPNDSSGSGSGGSGGKGGSGGAGDEGDVQATIEKTESLFDSMIDNLEDLGRYFNKSLKKLLTDIPWDTVQEKAYNFGKGFAEFLNGFLEDKETFYLAGSTISEAVNTILSAFLGFGENFEWNQLGVDIANFINGIAQNINWSLAEQNAKTYGTGIASAINSFVDEIDAESIGTDLANLVNTVTTFFSDLGKEIKWENIGTKFSQGVNSFIKTVKAKKLGKTFNTWARGILKAAITAVRGIDWKLLGTKIGKFLAGLDFKSIVKDFGELLVEAISGIISTITFSFKEAPLETALIAGFAAIKLLGFGKKLSEKLFGSKGVDLTLKVGKGILNWVKMSPATGAIKNLLATMLGVPVSSLGAIAAGVAGGIAVTIAAVIAWNISQKRVEKGLEGDKTAGDYLNNNSKINRSGKLTSTGRPFYDTDYEPNAILDSSKLKDNITKSIDEASKSAVVKPTTISDPIMRGIAQSNAETVVTEEMRENGKNAIAGFFKGIADKTTEIATNIKSFFDKFINKFKSVFGIHSPSTVMQKYGGYIVDGLKKGITDKISAVVKAVGDVKDKIIAKFTNIKNEFITKGSELIQGFADGVSKKWESVKSLLEKLDFVQKISDAFTKMKDTVAAKFDEVSQKVSGVWESVKTKLFELDFVQKISDAFTNIKNSISEAVSNASEKVKETWEKIKSKLSEKDFVGNIKTAFNDVKTNVQTALTNVHNEAKEKWENIKKKLGETEFTKTISTAFSEIKSKISENIKSALNTVKEIWNNIKSKLKEHDFKNEIASTFATVKDKIYSRLSEARDKVVALWDKVKTKLAENNFVNTVSNSFERVKTAISNKISSARGTVNAQWNNIKSTLNQVPFVNVISNAFTNIRNTISNALQSASSTVSTTWSNIKSTLSEKLSGNIDITGGGGGHAFANGGILVGGKWQKITQYASGGLPSTAEIFMARENGLPEMVGRIGSHTAIANNDQIVASVSDGVAKAVGGIMAQEMAVLRQQNQYLSIIAAKDMSISSRDIFNATRTEAENYMNRTGRTAFAF